MNAIATIGAAFSGMLCAGGGTALNRHRQHGLNTGLQGKEKKAAMADIIVNTALGGAAGALTLMNPGAGIALGAVTSLLGKLAASAARGGNFPEAFQQQTQLNVEGKAAKFKNALLSFGSGLTAVGGGLLLQAYNTRS